MLTISFAVRAECGDGTYFPEVCVDVEDGRTVRFPIPVKVDSSGVKILEKDVPSEISPTGSEQLTLAIANNRPTRLCHLSESERRGLGVLTRGEVFIGSLQPYETREIAFTVMPMSRGVREIVFNLSYKNGDNTHYESLKTSILVRGREDVRMILVRARDLLPESGLPPAGGWGVCQIRRSPSS